MTVALAAGGTGGHLIPALVYAQWLRQQGEQVQLITGSRPLEAEICAAFGEEPLVLPMKGSPLGAGLRHFPSRFWTLVLGYRKTAKLLKQLKPRRVLVFGGYLSFPVAVAALESKIPLAGHEQNAVAGKVTRLLRRWRVPVFTGWPRCDGVDSYTYTGTPVRTMTFPDRFQARRLLFGDALKPGEKLILVMGGSLGSSGMVHELTGQSMIELNDCRFCFMGLEQPPFDGALVLAPRWDMTLPYAAADAVICRAGGATLAEVQAYGLPALILPWNGASDGHQRANAQELNRLSGTPWWDGRGGADILAQKLVQVLAAPKKPAATANATERLHRALEAMEGK